jgi:hypothetical protein
VLLPKKKDGCGRQKGKMHDVEALGLAVDIFVCPDVHPPMSSSFFLLLKQMVPSSVVSNNTHLFSDGFDGQKSGMGHP